MSESSKIPDYWKSLMDLVRDDPAIYAAARCVEGGQKPEEVLVQLALCLTRQMKTLKDQYMQHLNYCSGPSLSQMIYGKKGKP